MDNNSNEMKVIIPKGCDNAPRKQIVIDFTVAVLTAQIKTIENHAHETITWHEIKEHKKIEGLSTLISSLENEENRSIDSLEIYQVITHGKFASINGLISLSDDSTIDFCDVYTFSSAAKSGKVKGVKSYRL